MSRLFGMPGRRRMLLALVFFGVALGLGYPALHRYAAPAQIGLDDVEQYRRMVRFDYSAVPAPFRHRVLVPTLAGVLHAGLGGVDLGTWVPEAAALLLVNAGLTALAALVLIELALTAGAPVGALGGLVLLYLASFTVSGAHLVGLVDSGEALAVLLVLWLVLRDVWRWVPAVLAVSALTKETAFLFCAVAALAVLVVEHRTDPAGSRRRLGAWLLGVGLGLSIQVLVHRALGAGPSPGSAWPPVAGLLGGGWLHVIRAKSLVYAFLVVGPLGVTRLARMPRSLVLASAAAGLAALCTAAWADIGENVARPLFHTVGPVLCVAGSIRLDELLGAARPQAGARISGGLTP